MAMVDFWPLHKHMKRSRSPPGNVEGFLRCLYVDEPRVALRNEPRLTVWLRSWHSDPLWESWLTLFWGALPRVEQHQEGKITADRTLR